jgi:hypothetical protein
MRGPHDADIKGPEMDRDHARRRLEEFMNQRFPGGVLPVEDTGEEHQTADESTAQENDSPEQDEAADPNERRNAS